jgi:2'-5' RNA ligase
LTRALERADLRAVRLFFSVPLTDAARAAAAKVVREMRRAAGSEAPLSWTKDEQLHFTIAFLGEQPEDALPRLRDAAASCAELRAFALDLRGAGAFPNARRPRILWLGVGDGAQQLEQLAGRLCTGLRERGFVLEERPFRGHLTAARVKPGGERAASRALESAPRDTIAKFTVASLCLMQSKLSPHGAQHSIVYEIKLA